MKKLFGLGRGLSSLIPPGAGKNIKLGEAPTSVFYVETHKVKANPNQPRQSFDDTSLKEMASSIKKYGILQPLLVTKQEKNSPRGLEVEYQLLAGERRWRAARLLNLPQVPVIIRDDVIEDKVKLELALVENLQREDLNPMEEAEAFIRLQKDFDLTQKEIGERVGKSREVVANSLRLLDLSSEMKESLRAGKISRTHARALLAFKDESERQAMYRQILGGGIATRHVEEAAYQRQSIGRGVVKESRFLELEKNLSSNLGTAVAIRSSQEGGKIVIKFTDLGELNKIVENIIG